MCGIETTRRSASEGKTHAEDKGFINVALAPFFNIFPDYVIPGVSNEAVATILAGIVGTLVLFGIGYGLAKLLRAKGEA